MLKRFKKREVSMRDRFMMRVLLPPFLLLVLIGGFGLWQLNRFLTKQAIDDLQIAARTTSIRLEREIAIRETVLKNTGDEISGIKANYVNDIAELEYNRSTCRAYYQSKRTFTGSPDESCTTFSISTTRSSLQLIEDGYVEQARLLQTNEITATNERLASFKQFFPETLAVMVISSDESIVSSAVSGASSLSVDDFTEYAKQALDNPVLGEVVQLGEYRLAIFAFPTESGSVLAAYDVNNENYVRPSWENTPIDKDKALAVIVQHGKNIVYPGVSDASEFLAKTSSVEEGTDISVKLGDVQNIIVAEKVNKSNWSVVVLSPEAIVLAPVRDTQFISVVIAGLFTVGFLWVGTFFIKTTTDNLAKLVTGAIVYGTGRLDYKLDINSSEREFRQLADTMYYMAQRIAQSEKENDERNKEFISIATHELRAPMTSIIGYLSLLQENIDKKLNKQDKMLLNTAYDGTIRLRDLINDMLDAARLEGGREEFQFVNLNISNYVEACLESMQVVAKQNEIKLEYNDKSDNKVYADDAKLRIILNNFVSNAIKYNHKNGKVRVSHTKHNGQIITAIANTGPTIPADQQEHMFEKFFRVDTPEHKKVTGTGIGMFVTKQYVEAMGGKVWFTSKSGEDTVFYFSLPTAVSQNKNESSTTTKPQQTNSKWIMRWRKRIQ